jgi:hypothetical protein
MMTFELQEDVHKYYVSFKTDWMYIVFTTRINKHESEKN